MWPPRTQTLVSSAVCTSRMCRFSSRRSHAKTPCFCAEKSDQIPMALILANCGAIRLSKVWLPVVPSGFSNTAKFCELDLAAPDFPEPHSPNTVRQILPANSETLPFTTAMVLAAALMWPIFALFDRKARCSFSTLAAASRAAWSSCGGCGGASAPDRRRRRTGRVSA